MVTIGIPSNVREVRRIIEEEYQQAKVTHTRAASNLWAWRDSLEVLSAAGDEIWYSMREYGGIPTWQFEPMRAIRIPRE